MRIARQLCYTLCAAACLAPLTSDAQYYDQGRSPANIRWNTTESAPGRIIFPDYYKTNTSRINAYFDSLAPHIAYGYSYRPLQLPVILHTQNMQANGIVIWAPKRMELLTIPDQKLYAEPWLKQLTAHEYRHAVQYSNLYRGFMKPLGWFIGQQSGLISSVLVPIWFLEGDATQAETQFATFGRALQPSFSIEYRAYLTEGTPRKFRTDKWFCGSYVDYIPNHYQLGYQLVAWSREQYGDNMWDPVMKWVSRYPYTILSTKFALWKYYKTSTNKMFRAMFAELTDFWKSLPKTENSSTPIATQINSYTVYDSPMPLDKYTILAFKKDFSLPNRLVCVDVKTGAEQTVTWTGLVSTPPVLRDSMVWWTEYRSDLFWEQRVRSKVCGYDLRTNRRLLLRDRKNALYATPLPGGVMATVGYDYSGHYSIDLKNNLSFTLPDSLSVHGMAWDDTTETLALLGLSDGGMAFYEFNPKDGVLTPLTKPNYSSVYNLRAGNGYLSYNSICSGKDEIHLYDLTQKQECQISESRYGSFSPSAPTLNDEIYFTTYSREGYLLARQRVVKDSLRPLAYSRLPKNTVNPTRRKWSVPQFNDLLTPQNPDTLKSVKHYRQLPNLFNFHSWFPAYLDPFKIAEESRFDIHAGVTLMSQNLLSHTTSTLSYGYSGRDGNLLEAKLNYGGLAPKFEFELHYSDQRQPLYGWNEKLEIDLPPLKADIDLGATVYLPILLSSGYHTRRLTPRIELNYENAKIYNTDRKRFDNGLTRMSWAVDYSDQVRLSHRDIRPRWGYALQLAGVMAPVRDDFGRVYSIYGRGNTPGVAAHHSLMIRGALQTQVQKTYNFYTKKLFPRGAEYSRRPATRYGSFSVDYQLPLCYPEWGLTSIFYINRIRLNAYYDRARYQGVVNSKTARGEMYSVSSFGGEIFFDMRPVRIPNKNTTIGVYLYNPSDYSGVEIGVHLTLPI